MRKENPAQECAGFFVVQSLVLWKALRTYIVDGDFCKVSNVKFCSAQCKARHLSQQKGGDEEILQEKCHKMFKIKKNLRNIRGNIHKMFILHLWFELT